MGCGSTKKRSDISDPASRNKPKTGPGIFLIRNALSIYDYWNKTYSSRAKRSGEVKASDIDPEYKYLEEAKSKWDLKLVDPGLQKKGVQEATEAKGKIAKLNLKYVFVSPLKRAMETSRKMLEGHPNKEKLKIYVHPLLRPILSNAKDIPQSTLSKMKKEYESIPDLKYDFTLIEDQNTLGDLFFFNTVNAEEKDKVIETINKSANKDDYAKIIIDAAIEKRKNAKKGGRKMETYNNMRLRAVQFGEFLTKFIATAGLKTGDDVLIFTHGNVISYCNSVFWDPEGRTLAPKSDRCTPIEFDYEQLLELEKQFKSGRALRTGLTAQLMPGGVAEAVADKSLFLVPLQTCSKGHQLFFSKAATKGENYDCVKCLKGGKCTDGRWNCLFCKYDVCTACKPALTTDASKKTCDHGHPLEEEGVGEEVSASFVCAKCKKEGTTASGKKRWVCIGCSYDICPNCV